MVTPTNGIATFVNGRTGETQSVSIYIADAVATDVKFSLSGKAAASSQAFINARDDMILRDLSITTGPTVIFTLIVKRDDVPIGTVVSIAQYLDTLNSRPPLAMPFRKGSKITMTEA